MKTVISANYKNRESENHWLVRNADQSVDETTELRQLHAINVTFELSDIEKGFGCNMVAIAEEFDSPEAMTVPPEVVQVYFINNWIYRSKADYESDDWLKLRIKNVSSLFLLPDGSIFVIF